MKKKMLSGMNLLNSKVGRFFTKSIVIAFFVGVIAFLLIPFNSDPYTFSLIESRDQANEGDQLHTFFLDLNSDGKYEEFRFGNVLGKFSSLTVLRRSYTVLDQWNFSGKLMEEYFAFISGDRDKNGMMELATLTLDSNRIYLNVVEPYGEKTFVLENKLIDSVNMFRGAFTPIFFGGEFYDLNGDGSDEVVFSYSSGYAKQPRKVYAYDLVGDSLWASPYAGNLISTLVFFDLNKDGSTEISGRCDAPYNYTDEPIFLSDSLCWFIVYNQQLNYFKPPIPLGPEFSRVDVVQLQTEEGLKPMVMVRRVKHEGFEVDWYEIQDNYDLRLCDDPFDGIIQDPQGYYLSENGKGGAFVGRESLAVFVNSNGKKVTIPNFATNVEWLKQLNTKNRIADFEYAFRETSPLSLVSFYNINGKFLGSFISNLKPGKSHLGWLEDSDGNHRLFISSANQFGIYEVRKNPWQYFRFLLLLGMIVGILGFIELIRFFQLQQTSRVEGMKREILEMQLRSVKNQLDPHFTFNALNVLSALSMIGDREGVNHFIDHFSRLLRKHLNSSDKTLVRIQDELEFVDHYMELQRLRFENQIILEKDIDLSVNMETPIPKMIIHTHVENAIKHGFKKHKQIDSAGPDIDSSGKIQIKVKVDQLKLLIIIEDNGTGRQNGESSSGIKSGIGLSALQSIYASVKQLYKMEVTQVFEDLKDEQGRALGTRVKIWIKN